MSPMYFSMFFSWVIKLHRSLCSIRSLDVNLVRISYAKKQIFLDYRSRIAALFFSDSESRIRLGVESEINSEAYFADDTTLAEFRSALEMFSSEVTDDLSAPLLAIDMGRDMELENNKKKLLSILDDFAELKNISFPEHDKKPQGIDCGPIASNFTMR